VLDGTPFQAGQENHPIGDQLSLDSVDEVVRKFQDLRSVAELRIALALPRTPIVGLDLSAVERIDEDLTWI
jgi:hypothetical protein